jgi:transposase
MFALTTTNIFYLYRYPADMRKSFDSLCGIVQNELQRNPSSGDVFIFINKPRNRMKMLHWERGGYLLYYKRLESGTLEMPEFDTKTNEYCIPWHELVMMVEGISVRNIKLKKRYMSVLTAYC